MRHLLTVVLLVGLIRLQGTEAAASDLKELKEVRSGLDHAQDSIDDLVDFLTSLFITTTTTTTTTSSTTSAAVTSTATTEHTNQPVTTNATVATEAPTDPPPTAPRETTTTTPTDPPTTIPTNPPTTTPTNPPTTIPTNPPTTIPTNPPTTIPAETTTTPTTVSTTTTTPTPDTTSHPITTTLGPTNPSDEAFPSLFSSVLRVRDLGLRGYKQALQDGWSLREPKGKTAIDFVVPLRHKKKIQVSERVLGSERTEMKETKSGEHHMKGRSASTSKELTDNGISFAESTGTSDTTNDISSSPSSTAMPTTTTTPIETTTPGPWWERVNECLEKIDILASEVTGGLADYSHADRLDREADRMQDLVEEGQENPEMVKEDFDECYNESLIEATLDSLHNATKLVDEQIDEATADKNEMIATITCLSLLFVGVLMALIVALIRPNSSGKGLSSQHNKKGEGEVVREDDSRSFNDARYIQRSHYYYDPYKSHTS